jgi:hypothetical protein
MLVAKEDIEGITINGVEHRISQFADDTQLLSKNFNSFEAAFKCIALYERASGMRINMEKYVGILCESATRKQVPFKYKFIQWLKPGQYTKILGIPYWSSRPNNQFWDDLYCKIKN